MNATTKTTIVDPLKMPAGAEFTPEMATRMTIEMRQTNVAGSHGFRIRCISDQRGDPRLTQAATQWRDDYDMGVEGVRENSGASEKIDGGVSLGGYSDALLDARKRHRECCQSLGLWLSSVLHLVLVGDPEGSNPYQPLSALQLGKRLGYDDRTAFGLAISALERLAEWYERPVR